MIKERATTALGEAEHAELVSTARNVRRSLLSAIHAVQTGHAGTSLSMIEILVLLYARHLRVDPAEPRHPERDLLILSKGHGAPGLYATMAHVGYFPLVELDTLRQIDSRLQGHPNANLLPGVDVCTGSLGQGLSIGLGLALGHRLREDDRRVFCILGDGELQEGQNWEAAMAAAGYGVGSIVAIVDRNRLQSDGDTENVLPLGDLAHKWRAFGWDVAEVNGHDFNALDEALRRAACGERSQPAAIIAHTVKGRGVSYMENVVHWHHHPLTDDDLERALAELAEAGP
jgi:transketolase